MNEKHSQKVKEKVMPNVIFQKKLHKETDFIRLEVLYNWKYL